MTKEAAVSSFPLGEHLSQEDQDRLRRRLSERMATVPSQERPSDELVEQTVSFLAKHPAQIPPPLRMYLLQDMVAQDYNTAITMLSADFQTFQAHHPAEAYVCRIVVDAWLIANGLRAIKWDEKVTSTIQAGKSRQKKSFLRRWAEEKFLTDEQKQTALVHESLDLAAKNEALRLENHCLGAENESISKRIQEVLTKATSDAERIINDARRDAASRERAAETKIERLKKEIARLEQAKISLLSENPQLAQTATEQGQGEYEDIKMRLSSLFSKFRVFKVSCSKQEMIRHITSMLVVLSEIHDSAMEIDDEHRGAILQPIFENCPEFNLRATALLSGDKWREYHPILMDNSILGQMVLALAIGCPTKEEFLLPLQKVLKTDLINDSFWTEVLRVDHNSPPYQFGKAPDLIDKEQKRLWAEYHALASREENFR